MRVLLAATVLLAPTIAGASPPGASSCTGCHAGAGTALPAIIGRSAAGADAVMAGFRDGSRPATLMNRIAKGFTPDETHAIDLWLEAQK